MEHNKRLKRWHFIREPLNSQWRRARWRWPLLLLTVLSCLYAVPQIRRLVQAPVPSTSQAVSALQDTAIQAKGQQALDSWKKGGPEDFKQAYALFEELASADEPHAQFMLGLMHMEGQFVPKSDAVAAVWFRRAAEQGYSDAQFNLAQILQDGDGVSPDDTQAAKWFGEAARYYQQAVDGGHIGAHHNLGLLYKNGEGVPVNYERAISLFQVAADARHASSQTTLGYMYAKGLGVAKDQNKSIFWLRKAADLGTLLPYKFS